MMDTPDRDLRLDDLIRPGARLGHAVAVKRVTGSTNDDARALAEAGAAEGVAVLAEEQEAGRGRLGRSWSAAAGQGLLFSVILRPGSIEHPGLVTLAAGVAICRTLRAEGVAATIKWPNDVRVGGRKIAGVLAEAGGDMGIVYVILGIGLNVNQGTEDFPPDLQEIATSIRRETGEGRSRAPLFRAAMAELEAALGLAEARPEELLAEWSSLSECRDRRVRAETPAGVFYGPALGVRADGALLICEESTGLERAIVAGDIFMID